MRIAIGADHRGFRHKNQLCSVLRQDGHQVNDCGCHGEEAADYPEPGFAVAKAVGRGDAERGILVCGSGIGMTIVANKVPGVRAALCYDIEAARVTRLHNDSNIICLSGDRTEPAEAEEMVRVWLETKFAGGRHARRLGIIKAFENERS